MTPTVQCMSWVWPFYHLGFHRAYAQANVGFTPSQEAAEPETASMGTNVNMYVMHAFMAPLPIREPTSI
jgi:hypothetical protein